MARGGRAAWPLLLVLGGCASDTGSRRFSFEAAAGGALSADGGAAPFTNQTGWTVTLSQAIVTLGPIYLNASPPLRSPLQSVLDRLVPDARAQATAHLDEGRIVGEVLAQVEFDALSPELVTFPVPGTLTEEEVRTADVWFYPAPGVSPEATRIDTVALEVSGEASRDGQTLRFHGALVLDDDWLSAQPAGTRGSPSMAEIRRVRGIAAPFLPEPGGRLALRFDVQRLFRGADFSGLDDNPVDEDGVRELVQERAGRDQVMNNLYQGLREANGTYAVSWEPGP